MILLTLKLSTFCVVWKERFVMHNGTYHVKDVIASNCFPVSQCLRWLYFGFWRWKPLTLRHKERRPWNPPTQVLKDNSEHVCNLWTHTHIFPTLTQHFIFVLTCRADLPSQASGLHCLNWAGEVPVCHCFTFSLEILPLWRPWVSCRKSTYDAWLCVCVWGGSKVRGEIERRATMEPILF